MPGTLICYGDSNTYGYDPHDTNEGRYPKEVRWTGILDTETDWKVENHGVNGRSIPHTVSTVKFACQQVRDWHRKPNSVWLLVMLGTNDLLENPDFTAADVAKRMERFLKRMMEEAGLASRKMRLRLIAPPAMQEGQWVEVTAKIAFENRMEYQGEGIVLYAEDIQPCDALEEEMVYFN